MGGLKLEVAKFSLYLAMPVTAAVFFASTGLVESALGKFRYVVYPPEKGRAEFEAFRAAQAERQGSSTSSNSA